MKTEIATLALSFSGVVLSAYGAQEESVLIYLSGFFPIAASCLWMRFAVRKEERLLEQAEREAKNREMAWRMFVNAERILKDEKEGV